MKVWIVVPMHADTLWGEIEVFSTKSDAKKYAEFMEKHGKDPLTYHIKEKIVRETQSVPQVTGFKINKSPRIPDYWHSEY